MADFVSRSKVEFELCDGNLPEKYKAFVRRVLNDKSLIPSADVAPVVHGRWEEADWVELDGGGNELIRTPNAALRCSVCCNCFKKELLWKEADCPNCGAKMDGGDPDGR